MHKAQGALWGKFQLKKSDNIQMFLNLFNETRSRVTRFIYIQEYGLRNFAGSVIAFEKSHQMVPWYSD